MILTLLLGVGESKTVTSLGIDGSTTTSTSRFIGSEWVESFLAVVSGLYSILFWRFAGGTLSQLALGLRVVDRARPGRLSWRGAVLRWVALYGWTVLGVGTSRDELSLVLELAMLIWLAVLLASTIRSHEHRGFHDLLGRDLVVSVQGSAFSALRPEASKPIWHD